ncbi:UNVERIFIED_CONTAM: hypothetical protein Sindi_3096500 [Sesamum indicum]
MGFADDLLLFYHVDMDSIGVFKIGLDRFAIWSGLKLNVQKSHLIISRSAQGLCEEMLTALGFQEGIFPMRYLGLPLLSSRLTIADCRPLLVKIDKRIPGWEGNALSYAGRVQIIKSVLTSLSLYWASAFILAKKVTNEIEKRLRTFLWKGTSTSGYAKVAWKDLCRPKEEGGLGFKDITLLNRALMAKKLCDIISSTRVDYEILPSGRLESMEDHGDGGKSSIGDGRRFYLWRDSWHHLGPLSDTFPHGPSTVITGGEWQWSPITDFECLEIEKSSDSGDILGGSSGKHSCTGAPSSDLALVTGKQAVGTNSIAAVTGLGVPPETQISPEENKQFTAMNRRTPTYVDVEPANDDVENADADVMHDVAADVTSDVSVEKVIPTTTQVRSFPMGLFVANIPLNMNPDMGVNDKIADAFNNSSRRTLSYIPPTIQNGEVVVRPTMETIRNGSTKWKTTAVGYFLGKRPYFYHVKDFAFSIWPGLREVKATTNGFFFFQFKTAAYMEEAIEGGL